jgi:voltage-gated potassium channel
MAMTQKPSHELKNPSYEIFIGLLSVLSIVNIILVYVASQDEDVQGVLFFMNALLSGIFIIDFSYRLLTAHSKSEYFFRQYGWADLLASLPFSHVKILRSFRLVRVYRLLREFGIKKIGRSALVDLAGSALLTLLLMGILVLEFGSVSVLNAEQHSPNANIKTASDALWYTLVTIATVGYGDRYPTTNPGRLIGALIMLIGVGIFGTFTGYLANLFLSPVKKKPESQQMQPEPGNEHARLEEFKQLLDEQEKTNAALRERLKELETYLKLI